MSSRRMMTRSYSADGRSSHYNGDDVSGSSWSGGRSYLSNVRPENRSTLCSIMAQLTEETQPLFETTLKSRAVSESCNVKFCCVVTGYPTPEVIWYKDDVQLDRYCGLPKYEIFRNGQNHSLHIYNCSVEDAAMYQASARNNKGIVSCSGVLEVGDMNEFKIHQRYFAKLKQKAENKRRELEGKENQGPEHEDQLRTISPDRSQRKRRSPMEPSLSRPSSTEDEGTEESRQTPAAETGARLQETTVEEAEEKPVPIANGAVSPITNGQAISEIGSKGMTYIYDSAQKVFIAHQPKTPFVKKKIKISSVAKGVKVDSLVSEERRTNNEVSLASTQSSQSQGTLEEVMEVESAVNSSPFDSGTRKVTEQCHKSDREKSREKEMPVNMPSEEQRVSVRGNVVVPRQKSSVLDLDSKKVTEQRQKLAREKTIPANNMPSEEEKPRVKGNVAVALQKSSVLDSDSRKVTEQPQKSARGKALPSEEEKMCVKGNVGVPPQKEQPISPETTAALPFTCHTVSGTEDDHIAELEKEVGHKEKEENLIVQDSNPPISPTQLQSNPAVAPQKPSSPVREDITKTQQDDAIMEADNKSSVAEPQGQTIAPLMHEPATVCPQLLYTSTTGTLVHRGFEFVDVPCEHEDVLPQHTCEQSGDQLSEKETSPSLKNASVSPPLLLSEVTQAHTQMNRNDAPVNLEPPPTQCKMDAHSPQKSPSGRETTTDDDQAHALHSPVQTAFDKMTQDTWDHSRGSNESHTGLFTDIQKSPLESPGDGENTQGCNISPAVQQSQVETAIKTVEETKIQVDERVEGNDVSKLLVQTENLAPNERIIEMETEIVALEITEQTKIKKTEEEKDSDGISVDGSHKQTETNEHMLKMPKDTCSKSQNLKPIVVPHITKNPDNTTVHNANVSEQQTEGFKEIPKPAAKIISIAELLRSQIKALECTVEHSVLPDQCPKAATEKYQELSLDDRQCKEVKKSKLDRKIETSSDASLPPSIKTTLLEVHHILTKNDREQMQSPNAPSPTAEALQKPVVIPPITVIDVGTNSETIKLLGSTERYSDSVMDTGQESGASTSVPLKHGPVSLSGPENVQIDLSPMTPKQQLSNRCPSTSTKSAVTNPQPGKQSMSTLIQMDPAHSLSSKTSSQDSLMSVLEPDKGERFHGKNMGLIENVTPEVELMCKTNLNTTERDSATLLDQHKEHKPTMGVSQSIQATKSVLGTETQGINLQLILQERTLSVVEEFSKTLSEDSITPPNTEASPLLRRRNGASPIPSATPQELASGARRKILIPKAKTEDSEAMSPADSQLQKEEASAQSSKLSPSPVTLPVSPGLSQKLPLPQPSGERTSPVERRSPLLTRKKITLEAPVPSQQVTQQIQTPKTEEKPAEKEKHDPYKAPQVIRKIRGESFSDTSGHLKLWCQFFNILSESTIRWYRDEVEISQIKRNTGDETLVNLAIVQASSPDCGVYGCTITNEHGTDSTDFLLSQEILAGMSLREDLGVGEEIEMTPLVLTKGVADSGVWGNKFFGRIMMQESHIGNGCSHKVWRAKVIYGLEPVFESGNTCVIKVRNPITYGGKVESNLIESNLDITKQECRIQNLAREYCKIFSAEARVIENFGPSLEVVPVYLMYRPANTVPYATVETDLKGVYLKYSLLDYTGRLVMRTGSEVEQKCCTLQHWIHQWTNGNLLLTRLEGVDTKITNVGISVKSTGYQGLSATGNPKVFEQFVSQHQCNYFCGLLGLRCLKAMDSLMTPSKPKGSRSPLLQRKVTAGSSSPQTGRKAAGSPRMPRKSELEQDSTKASAKTKAPKS